MIDINVASVDATPATILCLAEYEEGTKTSEICRWFWDSATGVLHCACGRADCPRSFPEFLKEIYMKELI